MNEKDIKIIATLMREQHGSYAEEFARLQIRHHRAKPTVSATWMAVLAALKESAPKLRSAQNG